MMVQSSLAARLVLMAGPAVCLSPQRFQMMKPATTALFSTRNPRAPSGELLHLFNRQVTNELQASQLYLSASLWCEANDFEGMAAYFRSESEEERGHALSFIDFANKRDIHVDLESLEAPIGRWQSAEEVWHDVLLAEMENTQRLLDLADAAASCRDHAVTTFLMPFHMVRIFVTGNDFDAFNLVLTGYPVIGTS